MASRRAPVCKFYLKDSCRYGDRCHFRHQPEDLVEICDSDSSEDVDDTSSLIPVRRVVFQPETDGQGHHRRDPYWGAKYGFTPDWQATRGLERFSTAGRSGYHEPQRRSVDAPRSLSSISRPSESHRHLASSRSSNWCAPGDEPGDTEEEVSSSTLMEAVREVISRIHQEAKQIENDKMWPLTSLTVLKDGTSVPGFVDHSPEEMRLAAYSARYCGSFDKYLDFHKSVMREAEESRKVFLRPSKKAEDVVWNMLNLEMDGPKQGGSSNTLVTSVPEFCAFGSTGSFPFGSSEASLVSMGAPVSSPIPPPSKMTTPSIFGYTVENDPLPGIFSMAAAGFGSSSSLNSGSDYDMEVPTVANAMPPRAVEGNPSVLTENLFGQVPLGSPKTMKASAAPNATATASVSGGAGQTVNSKAGSGASGSLGSADLDDGLYTPMDQLSLSDLEQFQADTFTLEKLPLVPPPKELR